VHGKAKGLTHPSLGIECARFTRIEAVVSPTKKRASRETIEAFVTGPCNNPHTGEVGNALFLAGADVYGLRIHFRQA